MPTISSTRVPSVALLSGTLLLALAACSSKAASNGSTTTDSSSSSSTDSGSGGAASSSSNGGSASVGPGSGGADGYTDTLTRTPSGALTGTNSNGNVGGTPTACLDVCNMTSSSSASSSSSTSSSSGGCSPTCLDAKCGPDGCGGSCGTCPTNETCSEGQCVAACSTETFQFVNQVPDEAGICTSTEQTYTTYSEMFITAKTSPGQTFEVEKQSKPCASASSTPSTLPTRATPKGRCSCSEPSGSTRFDVRRATRGCGSSPRSPTPPS